VIGATELGFINKGGTTPGMVKLLRILKKKITVLQLDEFLTTLTCSICFGWGLDVKGIQVKPRESYANFIPVLKDLQTVEKASKIFIDKDGILDPRILELWVNLRKEASADNDSFQWTSEDASIKKSKGKGKGTEEDEEVEDDSMKDIKELGKGKVNLSKSIV